MRRWQNDVLTEFNNKINVKHFRVNNGLFVWRRDVHSYRPISRRLGRCDRMIQNESRDPNGRNMYYVTMQITFLMRKFQNVERNLHCDLVHITTVWVSSLTLDCNGVFAIKAYDVPF